MGETLGSIAVLHVDDDPALADVAGTFLEREDDRLDVRAVTRPQEALDVVDREAVDCVVSDYDMPGMNGIEFLEAVREDHPALPFILFTGKGSEEVASEAISAGVTDYLQKESGTGQYAVLANRIANVVEQHRSQKVVERTERKLSEIADRADDVLFMVDGDWDEVLFVNSTYEDVWDASIADLEADPSSFLDAVHPADRATARESMERLSGGDPDVVEYRVRSPSGEYRWIRGETKPILDADGTVDRIVGFVRDVDDQKRRQRELRRKERRYQAVFNDPNILVGLTDTAGTVLDINERAMDYVDADRADVIGTPLWDTPWFANAPDVTRDVREWLDRAAAGEYVETEVELERPRGESYVLEGVIRPVRDGDGAVGSLLISYRDVTERTARERELRRYEAYLEESTDVVTVLDAEGTITYESPAVSRILGYDPGELIGQQGFEYVHPDDHELVVETFTDLVSSPGETVTVQCRFRTADDGWRWLEVRGTNQLDHDDIEGIVTNNRDITARKEREQELEQTSTVLSTLVETLPLGVLAEDASRNVLAVNQRFFDLFDLAGTPEGVVGADCATLAAEVSEMFVDPEGFVERIDDLIDAREAVHEEELALADGRTFSRSHEPIELPTGEGHLWVYRDVTDRDERERELQRQNDRLEEFSSIVSHDLRNPLNVAVGHLELLDEECESDHVDAVGRAHDRMETLITDLLTLAREGETSVDPTDVDLKPLAERCWEHVETGGARLVVDAERTIRADESRIRQCLENLFRNAVEYGSRGPPSPTSADAAEHGSVGPPSQAGDEALEADGQSLTVTLGALPDGFYVEDDGVGTEEAQREAVLQPGHSTRDGGTGFGLTIVQQVADAHGWDVRVTEGSAGGARFEFTGVSSASQ